ncbi:MAG: CRISPR-associated protein Cas4 [Candidatus Thorarchaeota archaeon]
MRITGVMVQYHQSCHRELWFYAHGINMNFEDENILIGRRLHETVFKRQKKNIMIDDTIAIDFKTTSGGVVIFEIKKSRKLTHPAEYQLLYYLYYLERMGVRARGTLVYPTERKRVPVILTDEKRAEIQRILDDIPRIVALERPPDAVRKPYCKNCSYYDLCRV